MSNSHVTLVDTCYGKGGVKILFVKRPSSRHEITEYEVSTLLTLSSTQDYERGDNSLVIPTDTQKNTVYAAAQKYGVGCPEEFAGVLCKHFLRTYSHVVTATVRVDTQHGWRRIEDPETGRQHDHAFVASPRCQRWAEVTQSRNTAHSLTAPHITAGLSGLRILKTTQSAFVNFHRCPYTTLTDAQDRILSTVVDARWKYDPAKSFNMAFDDAWQEVFDCIIREFAGPSSGGLYSPSVQMTIYDTEKQCLSRVPQMNEMTMMLPNVHYFEVDMNRFKDESLHNTKNVYLPTDKPSGIIKATLARTQSKL